MQDPQPLARPVLPAQEVISLAQPDDPVTKRWIKAKTHRGATRRQNKAEAKKLNKSHGCNLSGA